MTVCLFDTWFLLLHDKISLSTSQGWEVKKYEIREEENERDHVHLLWVNIWTALEVQPASVDVESTQCCVHLWGHKVLILKTNLPHEILIHEILRFMAV